MKEMESAVNQDAALKWIGQLFEEDAGRLTPDTDRAAVEAWDSLGVLTLMAGLDNDFGIVLSDGEIQNMKKVGDILEILRKNGKLR
jgi:acyl carrier protein